MRKIMTAAVMSLALLTTTAYADQFYKKDAGQWTVEGFKGETNFCSASTFWPNDSYVSFFVTDQKQANILVHNTEWNIGDPTGHFNGYKATIRFFGKYPSEQGTIDYNLTDAQTVLLQDVNVEFLKDWTKFDAMVIIMPGDISQMSVGLDGTNVAVSLMGECLDQLTGKSGQNL